MKSGFIICFIFLLALGAAAQQGATEQQLEALTEILNEELEDDTYLQQLGHFKRHPFNINTALAEDLQWLKWLTPLQIQSLLQYRTLVGPFIDLHELQAVPHWDVATIRRTLPFVTTGTLAPAPIASLWQGGEHSLLLRHSRLLQRQQGYDRSRDNHYAGSGNKVLVRYKYQQGNHLQWGATAEKDAGETFFKTLQNPFDFYGFHFYIKKKGLLKALAIGDYTVNMGQGLVQWQALAFKKSSEVLSIVRQSPIIRPYSGAGEFYFNRGVAATFGKGRWEGTLFASSRRLSARLQEDSSGQLFVTSFNTSGLHRTASEMANRKNTTQSSGGGNITYRSTRLKVGLNAVQHFFSLPLQRRPEPYNLHAISGSRWANASVDFSYSLQNLFFFGEAASDQKGFKAFLQGALASLHPQVDLALLYRNLSPAYQSLYGNAFTESVLPANEKGLYIGLMLRPHPAWRVQAYADHYHFPWLRARIDAPGSGAEYLLQLQYARGKNTEAYLRLKRESKATNERASNGVLNEVAAPPKQNVRLHLSHAFSGHWQVRARTEGVWYGLKEVNRERGWLLFSEAHYTPAGRLSLNARLLYFNTGGFNSRIYVYESDVLYGYSIPFFTGRGWRYYVNGSYNAGRGLTIWLRWAQTALRDAATLGSGLEMIDGNRRTEIKVQLRWTF